MITREEILEFAGQWTLTPPIVEKDYVIGWLLLGIYQHPSLSSDLLFKGGTCLKKCYFETYRFSEDLDFTVTNPELLNEDILRSAFTEVAVHIYEQSGVEIPEDMLRFDLYTNPRGQVSCRGRIYYVGPLRQQRGGTARVKLDISADEVVVRDSVPCPVGHPYSDAPEPEIQARCYSYEELFAEKIRALGERGSPRDLYDVVNIFRREQKLPSQQRIVSILRTKCDFKGIPLPTLGSLELKREQMRADWEAMLGHQLPELLPFDSFWSVLSDFFLWLGSPRAATDRPSIPTPAGSRIVTLLESPPEHAGSASALHLIRFAAANHLCVDLLYNGTSRRIEPYSLRRTQEGNVLLHAVRTQNGELRSYRLDRIQGAQLTRQTFTPRYAVELTPTGPLNIPSSQSSPGASS